MQEMQVWSLGGEDSLEKENGNLLQYSYQDSPVDRGDGWTTIHGVTKSWTWLSTYTYKLETSPLSHLKLFHSAHHSWWLTGWHRGTKGWTSGIPVESTLWFSRKPCGTRLQLVANRDLIITCITHCSTHSPEHTPPLQKKPHFWPCF